MRLSSSFSSSAAAVLLFSALALLLLPSGCHGQSGSAAFRPYSVRSAYTVPPTASFPPSLVGITVSASGLVYATDVADQTVVALFANGATRAAYRASFSRAVALAVDASGTALYIADSPNQRVVVLFAANGTQRAGNGVYQTYTPLPRGVAVDGAGQLYVTSASTGTVVVLSQAGALKATFSNSAYSAFITPCGIALDAAGNVYVGDQGLGRVVVLRPDGTQLRNFTTTSATGGFGPNGLTGVAVDSAGNVFVTDYDSLRLIVFASSGAQLQVISLGVNPLGVAVDVARNVYVTSDSSNRVLVLSPAPPTYYQRSLYTDAIFSSASLGGVVVNSSGFIFVTSPLSSTTAQVTVLSPTGTVTNSFTDGFGSYSNGVDVDTAGVIYVCDYDNDRLVLLNPAGSEKAVYRANGRLLQPVDVAVDAQGSIYLALGLSVLFLYPGGALRLQIRAGFVHPGGIVVSPTSGLIYVTDRALNRVFVLNPDGSPSFSFAATDAFVYPNGIALDSGGNVFVCDENQDRLVVFYSDGTER